MTTDAERAVRARYPDAECWRAYVGGDYAIYPNGIHRALPTPALATGPTPEQAWANAAARLDPPVAPRPATR